jgi:hypothetical protein
MNKEHNCKEHWNLYVLLKKALYNVETDKRLEPWSAKCLGTSASRNG